MPSLEASFRIVRDLTLDVAYFPLWWYSAGLIHRAQESLDMVRGWGRVLAIPLWVKNIFTPMYGQVDWQSRLISIFMRSVQIVGRSIAFVVISLFSFFLLLLYILIPLVLGVLFFTHAFLSGSTSYVG